MEEKSLDYRAVSPRRVCMVTGEYPPRRGGVADYTALLVDALRARGHAVQVVTTGQLRTFEGDEVKTVPHWNLDAARQLAHLIRSTDADVVHLQYQTAAFGMSPIVNALPLILRRLGATAAFVTTFHDLRPPYLFPKAGPVRSLANHLLVGLSDACIFTDPWDLVRAHPRRPHAWVPMGPTVLPRTGDDRSSARRALDIPQDETILGYFGFVNASKGVDRLLLASERLARAGLEFRLLFVGDSLGASDPTNAATNTEIWALADRLGMTPQMIHTGPLHPDALSRALRAPDLFVLPFVDGASLRRSSLLTCLAHGVPVVTTRVERFPRLRPTALVPPFDQTPQRDLGKGVLSVAGSDSAALARTIYRALNDPATLDLAASAGEQVTRSLSWSQIAAGTEHVYRRAAGFPS